jgi:hypothetical protein
MTLAALGRREWALIKQERPLFVICVLSSLVLMLSAILIPSALFDDYQLFQPDQHHTRYLPHIWFQLSVGRPLAGVLIGLYAQFIKPVSSLGLLRLVNAAIFGIFAFHSALFLVKLGVSRLTSLFLALIFLSLPGFVSVGFWTSAAAFPPAVCLALWGSQLLWSGSLRVAAAAFFGSMLFYPSFTVFAVVYPLAALLFSPGKNQKRLLRFAHVTCLFVAGSFVAYFAFNKLIWLPFCRYGLHLDTNSGPYSFNISRNIADALSFFVRDLTPAAANFMSEHSMAFQVLVLAVNGVALLVLVFDRRYGKPAHRALILGTLGALVVLSALHVTVGETRTWVARAIVAYSGSMAVLFIWGLSRLKSVGTVLCAVTVCFVWATGTVNVLTSSLNGYLEMRFLIAALSKDFDRSFEGILVRKLPNDATLVHTVKNNGFNWTSYVAIGNVSCQMINMALNELKDPRYVPGCGFDSLGLSDRKPIIVKDVPPGTTTLSLHLPPLYRQGQVPKFFTFDTASYANVRLESSPPLRIQYTYAGSDGNAH